MSRDGVSTNQRSSSSLVIRQYRVMGAYRAVYSTCWTRCVAGSRPTCVYISTCICSWTAAIRSASRPNNSPRSCAWRRCDFLSTTSTLAVTHCSVVSVVWIIPSFWTYTCIYTHTHPFNGLFSGTTRVSRYQKGKTNLDFTEARDSEWQWHPLGHMQVCTSLQTDNYDCTPPLTFLQARCSSCHPTNSIKALMQYALICCNL